MRKILVSLACSADGFIARADGSVDWLKPPTAENDYGLGDFLKTIDTIVWGRKTYEQSLTLGFGADFYPGVRNVVFSKRAGQAAAGVEFVHEPVADFARQLRPMAGKDVWIMGGATILSAFLDAGEVDELIIAKIPVLIGEGIPLLSPRHRLVPLELLRVKPFPDGVVNLHYRVKKLVQ